MTTSHPPPPRLTQGHRMQIQLQLDGAATLLRVVDCNVSEKSSGDKKNYQNKIEESPCLSSALASATSTSEVFLCSRPKCWVRDISGQVGKTLNLQWITWDHTVLWLRLLPSPSSLCLLHHSPANLRHKVLWQGSDFCRLLSRLRRWQASASK